MGTFGMDTAQVHTAGANIGKQAEEFGYNHKRISEIVDGIIASEYTSSDAVSIAESIKNYDPLLKNIQLKLEAHGVYGIDASRQTAQVNEDITSNIARNL